MSLQLSATDGGTGTVEMAGKWDSGQGLPPGWEAKFDERTWGMGVKMKDENGGEWVTK